MKSNVILQQYQDSNFSQDEHIAIEKELLEKMDWNALQVTHFDFMEHYQCAGIFFEDDEIEADANSGKGT